MRSARRHAAVVLAIIRGRVPKSAVSTKVAVRRRLRRLRKNRNRLQEETWRSHLSRLVLSSASSTLSFSTTLSCWLLGMLRSAFEGVKVLQLYTLDKISSGTPIPVIDQTFVRRVFASVSRFPSSAAPTTTNDASINAIRDQYALTRPPGEQWTSNRYLSQLLTSAARAYVVNFQTRTIKLIRYHLERWPPSRSL